MLPRESSLVESAQPPGTDESARLFRGSAAVWLAGVVDQALRMVTMWWIARVLGAAGLGAYSLVVTTVALLGVVAPLGLASGVMYQGSRYSDDPERLKGVLLGSLTLAGAAGAAGALFAGFGAAWFTPERVSVQTWCWVAPVVVVQALLLVSNAALRAARDVRAQVCLVQILLPAALTGFTALALAASPTVASALAGWALANASALAMVIAALLRRYPLLRNPAVRPVLNLRALLGYSIPQGVADVVYRGNLWADVLLLGLWSSLDVVGNYRVAVALAMVASVPAMAVQSVFPPVAARYLRDGDLVALREATHRLSSALLAFIAVPTVVVVGWPDALLGAWGIIDPSTRTALVVLWCGQLAQVTLAPVASLLALSGSPRRDAALGVAALAVNLCIQRALVPTWGAPGAALGTAIGLGIWSIARAVAGWGRLGLPPWRAESARFALGGGVAVAAMVVVRHRAPGGGEQAAAVVGVALVGFAGWRLWRAASPMLRWKTSTA